MNNYAFTLTLGLLLLLPFCVNGQTIKGVVSDQDSKITLPRATVYQDGTTNMTITDENGEFELNTRGLNNTLIIRFIGYFTERIENPFKYNNKYVKLYLSEELVALDEVVIGNNSRFTRAQMLRAFREQFLGTSAAALRCKIKNEDDLILRYNTSEKKMTATSRNPLEITNNYLEYEISFDLVEMVVTFNSTISLHSNFVTNTYFSGSTFYTDISKKNKIHKKRDEVFQGSIAHFLHALSNKQLKQQKWDLIVDGNVVNVNDYLKITDSLQFKKIRLIKIPQKVVEGEFTGEMLKNITKINSQMWVDSMKVVRMPTFFTPYYNSKQQSILDFRTEVIYVDSNGNYSPIYGLVFGGYLGMLKLGDLLPTNYYQTSKERLKSLEK